MQSVLCPKCESANTSKYSRQLYFIKMTVCLASSIPGYLTFLLLKADIFEPPANSMLLAFLIFFCIGMPAAVYYCVKGILIKRASYDCHNCENVFYEGFKTQQYTLDNDVLLNNIRKQNLS